MSEENKQQKEKVTKDRSVAYPSITLPDAIELASKLRDGLGKGPYSREEAARAMGHPKLSGPAARKVAALVHYSLLERTGNAYYQTHVAQDILKPLSDDQKTAAIIKAVRSPRLFEKLLQTYSGQALPTMLHNVLIRERVSESASDDVVRIFTESIKFAGIYTNGVVATLPPIETEDQGARPSEVVPVPTNIHPSVTTSSHPTSNTPLNATDYHVFEFTGGIKLMIPKTEATSEAIVDGELKEAKTALTDFAGKFLKVEEDNMDQD